MNPEIKFLKQKFALLAIEMHDKYNDIHVTFYPQTKTIDVSDNGGNGCHGIAHFYDHYSLEQLQDEYDKLVKFDEGQTKC